MNPIEQLAARLREWSDEVELLLDPPQYVTRGTWFLNVSCYGNDLQITWSAETGFGIPRQGENARHWRRTLADDQLNVAYTRAVALLSGGRHLQLVH